MDLSGGARVIHLVAAVVVGCLVGKELSTACPITRTWWKVCPVCWCARFALVIAFAAAVA